MEDRTETRAGAQGYRGGGGALGAALLAVLIGAITVYLSFSSGGYFAGASSIAALVLALALLVRVIVADDPIGLLSRPLALAAGALMLLAVWQLLSAGWSDSSARALIEYNRTLLYLVALLLFGTTVRTVRGLRWVVWGIAGAMTAICVVGFLTRAMPDVFTVATAVQKERLSYPIGYWNALGLLAAVALVLCIHLTSSEREARIARVLGAAALPLLGATLLFTFSRGPLAVFVVGAVAYALIARPRALLTGLLSAGPPVAVAVVTAYRADLLASKDPTTAAAAAQGHDVAQVILLCVVAAGVLRSLMLWIDTLLANIRVSPRVKRSLAVAAAAATLGGVIVVLAATDVPDRLEAQYERFTESDVIQTGDYRDRLTDPGINRFEQWDIAVNAFNDAPARGQGAGTYALLWDRDRTIYSDSQEAHSLYLEFLAELGLVGAALLVLALLALLVGVAARVRGRDRALYAAVLVAALMWLLHAGVDWDWEVPAVSLWLFALAGAAVAAPLRATPPERRSLRSRLLLGAACIAAAATPALLAASQSKLNESLRAFEREDCITAVDRALGSLDALGNRPEPYEVLGYCYTRQGDRRRGIEMMRAAVARDPRNWEYHYGHALVRAAAGRDPRPAARAAIRLNPGEPRAQEAVRRFRSSRPSEWQRAAREVGLDAR